MVRAGPCWCPTCPKKQESLGQWTYVPQAFKDAHPEHNLPENACVNKKTKCHEWCGLKEPATKGRPPSKKAKLNEPAVAVAVQEAEALAFPRKIKSIDEIWGVRYAAAGLTPTDRSLLPHCARTHARRAQVCCHRGDVGDEAGQQAALPAGGVDRVRLPRHFFCGPTRTT